MALIVLLGGDKLYEFLKADFLDRGIIYMLREEEKEKIEGEKGEEENILPVDEFIKDINKLMMMAQELDYDDNLMDCAVLYKLAMEYIEVKEKTGLSEADILYHYSNFNKVLIKMTMKIENKAIILDKNKKNVEVIEAQLLSLKKRGQILSEEMLEEAGEKIAELASDEGPKLELTL